MREVGAWRKGFARGRSALRHRQVRAVIAAP